MAQQVDGESACHRVLFLGANRNPSLLAETIQLPELKPGDILAKVRLAAICSSDLHMIHGRRLCSLPNALGHEAVLEVVSHKRSSDSDLVAGQRVTFSIADVCNKCNLCQIGLPQKCSSIFKYGSSQITSERNLSGCYATHIILHPGTYVCPIPDHVTDKMAALVNCSLATMVNAVFSFSHANARSKSILLQGAGLLGVYGCALLHSMGIGKVFVSDIDKERLSAIPAFGGIPILAGNESKYFNDDELDVVIEVCGINDVIKYGVQHLRPGGTYVLVGLMHEESSMDIAASSIIKKCITVKGVHNYAPEHLKQAVEFMSQVGKNYPFEQLVGPVYPISNFEEAFVKARTGKFRRVCLSPS